MLPGSVHLWPVQLTVLAYMFHPDFPTESQINLGMLQRGFVAAESLAPNLQYVILPTGTKASPL